MSTTTMDVLSAIMTRRSVRSFLDQEIPDDVLQTLLACAMQAPSAGGAEPWEFIVIKDKAFLREVGNINIYAKFAVNASHGILICGNLAREKFAGYWIEDTSAAMQNLLLAAHGLGLGACWTGIYPMEDRVKAFQEKLKLPENVIPLGLAIVGYPKTLPAPKNRFDASRIHYEFWGNTNPL